MTSKKRRGKSAPAPNVIEDAQKLFQSDRTELTPLESLPRRAVIITEVEKPPTSSAPNVAPAPPDDTPTVEFMAIDSVDNLRGQRVIELAQENLRLIQEDLLEQLTIQPDLPEYWYRFTNLPQDVIAVVVASLIKAGWKAQWDGMTAVHIPLPHVSIVAASWQKNQVSTVKPL